MPAARPSSPRRPGSRDHSLSASEAERAVLRTHQVSYAYDEHPLLREVTVDVPRGQIVGLLGPNGTGKTTLLKLLAGFIRPDAGEIWLDERRLSALTRLELARRIAVVPQETQSTFDYSVLEMVLMGRHPHLGLFQVETAHDVAIAREALAATGTADLEDRAFPTLSGGEKQRVVIAGALAQATDLLLLDEPTSSLDLRYQVETAALLRELNRARGITMLVSTHDLHFAASVCHRVILLREGQVLAAGETGDVLTAAHVSALYDIDVDVRADPVTGHLTVTPQLDATVVGTPTAELAGAGRRRT